MIEEVLMKDLPKPSLLTAPYWQACREGLLTMQQCDSCKKYQFYPRTICSHCGEQNLSWSPVSGLGTIKSFTVVRRGVSRAYDSPYILALIDLDEGPCMMSSIVESEIESVSVGAAVRVIFCSWGDDFEMPVFRLR